MKVGLKEPPPAWRFGSLVRIVVASVLAIFGALISEVVVSAQQIPPLSPVVLPHYQEAALLFQNKDFENALKKYQTALDQARLVEDDLGAGLSLAGIGAAHQAAQRYTEALVHIRAALPYFEKTRSLGLKGLALATIGEVETQLGHDQGGIIALDEALVIGREFLSRATEQERPSIQSPLAMLQALRGATLGRLHRLCRGNPGA